MIPYSDFFRTATGNAPYPYQQRLAVAVPTILDVPTGLGKTEATVLAWLYRRQSDADTPRRLLYCLPMRSLVEQTRARIVGCIENLSQAGMDVPNVEVVMGGIVGEDWFRFPERPCVVVGTQDMLLSRALNRGYGMSRFQWPMTFGATNNDAYWVIDEVQLQGIGAITASQLQAFRERFGTFHRTELTLASATIDENWFETADFSLNNRLRVSLGDDDRANPAVAQVFHATKRIERVAAASDKEIAAVARERHRPGTRTLVVVNRVARAQEVFRQLKRDASDVPVVLLHSRFRPPDRARHADDMIEAIDPSGPGRIIVATQVIEAGVDVSATTLITDVAPWSSIIQRFGRCNRRGNDTDAACLWIDAGEKKKAESAPYEPSDLSAARELLIGSEGASAAPADLPRQPIPQRGGLVIRKPEFFDLFDTSQDLAGHDVDVSPYIREADEMSVVLFWRDEPPNTSADAPRGKSDAPQRDELCAAPVSRARELIRALRAGGHGSDARIGNQFTQGANQVWTEAHDDEIHPGVILWLRSDAGWYDPVLGFSKVQQHVEPVSREPVEDFSESCQSIDSDTLSEGMRKPIPLTQHAQDSLRHARALVAAVQVPEPMSDIVTTAALWHDAGKAHPVFQDTMRRANAGLTNEETTWAKGVKRAYHRRPGFRHELPGALAYLHIHSGEPDADAIAFLIAAHHGKLRMTAQQLPYEAELGVFQLMGSREGETVPGPDLGNGVVSAPITLTLEPFRVGSRDERLSWVERTTALRDNPSLGPFRLAFMELLVRLADWRASKEEAE